MPATQQEVLRLSRDVESGRAVYLQLLNRQQELNIAKSSAIGNVRVIDNAVTDPEPVKTQKSFNYSWCSNYRFDFINNTSFVESIFT